MTWWAAGAAIVGGVMASDSAADGLDAQREGAAKSDATQRYMYDTSRADNAPTMQRGNAAGNKLSYLMGLGGSSVGGAPAMTAEQYRTQLLPQYTRTGAAAPGRQVAYTRADDTGQYTVFSDGTEIGGIYASDPSAPQGGTQQIDEAGLSAAIQSAMARQQSEATASAGAASSDPAYGSLLRNFSEPAPEMRKFGASDLAGDLVYQNGLQFGLDEGRKGIERQQSATGGLLSGATLKALSRFGNDYGTTKTSGAYDRFNSEQQQGYGRYVDKYNRYNTDQGNQFNRLSTIAGSGQVATGQVGAAGQAYANSVSQTAQGMGNATAAAGIAGSNALSGGIQNAYGNYQQNQLLQNLRGSSGTQYRYNPYGNAFSDTGDY